jgi:hypothetical protein
LKKFKTAYLEESKEEKKYENPLAAEMGKNQLQVKISDAKQRDASDSVKIMKYD